MVNNIQMNSPERWEIIISCVMHNKQYVRAVATGPVGMVSTGPIFRAVLRNKYF